MNFSWANILKKLKWHKVYTSHCRVRINKTNDFQKGHLLDFFSMYILYIIYIAWWGYKPIFCLMTLFYLPNLHSSDLLRQVLKTALPRMCKCAQLLNEHLRTCILLWFLSFFTPSAFQDQHNRNKKKPPLPYYWITKQCVLETPFRVLRRSKGRCSARTPWLQEFWSKEIPTQSCVNDDGAARQEAGEDWKVGEAGLAGRMGSRKGKMKGQKRQEGWAGLQRCCWDRPPAPCFPVSVFLKF